MEENQINYKTMLGLDKKKIQELVAQYYERMKAALDFQADGNIIEYTRSMIEARQIADQLEYANIQN